jgi:flagellar FliL protein
MAMPLDDPKKDSKLTEKAESKENAGAAKKKGLPSFVIYIGILVVVIAGGYFGTTKFLGSAQKDETPEVAGSKEPGQTVESDNGGDALAETEMINIEDIIVNPSGTGGTRFLSASIGFEVTSLEAPKLFEKKMPMIRDALIAILGSKTIEQLSDPKEKEITRYQIKKRVEQLLKTDDLAAVYFTDFVLQ